MTPPPGSGSPRPTHRPRKRFGQNFLHDRRIIERILEALAPAPGDHILEIGPGEGALTRHLLASAARVDAVELDRNLAGELQPLFAERDNGTLHQGDILRFDIGELTDQPASLRIVGNLPYNISTPCLFHLFRARHLIHDMLFMLQREVVARLASAPGEPDYGRLGIMTQYHCRVEPLFDVPREAFTPRPRITSTIVRLVPHDHPPYPARDPQALQTVVRTAFTRRRKTLKNALKGLITEDDIRQAELDPGQRPETLALPEFVRLSDILARKGREASGDRQ